MNTQNENTTTSTSCSKRFYFYARFRLVSPLPLRSSAQPMSLFYCYSCNYYCYSVDVHRTILLYRRRRQRRHQRIVHIAKISRDTENTVVYLYITCFALTLTLPSRFQHKFFAKSFKVSSRTQAHRTMASDQNSRFTSRWAKTHTNTHTKQRKQLNKLSFARYENTECITEHPAIYFSVMVWLVARIECVSDL